MNKEFAVHMLNETGKAKAHAIAKAFDDLMTALVGIDTPNACMPGLCGPSSRELSIAKTKLEEACFFAKKAMASQPSNTTATDGPEAAETRAKIRAVYDGLYPPLPPSVGEIVAKHFDNLQSEINSRGQEMDASASRAADFASVVAQHYPPPREEKP